MADDVDTNDEKRRAENAASRVRGARWRQRRRESKGLVRWDARCGYDGVVLAHLILKGHLKGADSGPPAERNGYEVRAAAPLSATLKC